MVSWIGSSQSSISLEHQTRKIFGDAFPAQSWQAHTANPNTERNNHNLKNASRRPDAARGGSAASLFPRQTPAEIEPLAISTDVLRTSGVRSRPHSLQVP